eukprot:1029669-Prymnesium_polylepis.2
MSVIGGAQEFNVSDEVLASFKKGLAEAVQAVGAWVITGGTNSGAMAVVGSAFANVQGRVVVLAIAPHHRELMEGSKGRKVSYPKDPLPNSADGAH